MPTEFASAQLDAVKPAGGLTPRELEILRLVAAGLTTTQMTDQRCTSPRTIKTHRQSIMEKKPGPKTPPPP